jgi:hypothetical protein
LPRAQRSPSDATLTSTVRPSNRRACEQPTTACAAAPAPASATACRAVPPSGLTSPQTRPSACPPTAHDRLVVSTTARIPKVASSPTPRHRTIVPGAALSVSRGGSSARQAPSMRIERPGHHHPYTPAPKRVGASTSGDLNHVGGRAGASTAKDAGCLGVVPCGARDPRRRRGDLHAKLFFGVFVTARTTCL